MKKTALLVAIFAATITSEAQSASRMYVNTNKFEGRYVCHPIAAGGIAWSIKSKKWIGTGFQLDGSESLVLTLKAQGVKAQKNGMGEDEDAMSYKVDVLGMPAGIPMSCLDEDNYIGAVDGFLGCDLILYQLRMNMDELRYMTIRDTGFINGQDATDATPSINIGTCRKVD
ncbi:hypothetical protein ABID26_004056 [Mesorhizobium shonense]|uniref:Uncharacterized protein n=1 Tax=Mesorhizobium shonense TaxID=1209948 RepID=A0ABV2HWE4_9HYPH